LHNTVIEAVTLALEKSKNPGHRRNEDFIVSICECIPPKVPPPKFRLGHRLRCHFADSESPIPSHSIPIILY